MKKAMTVCSLGLVLLLCSLGAFAADTSGRKPQVQKAPAPRPLQFRIEAVDSDGTVHVPAFALPLSPYMSQQARQRFIENAERQRQHLLEARRQAKKETASQSSPCPAEAEVAAFFRSLLERNRALYPVNIEEQSVAGVQTHLITPQGGVTLRNRDRVVIQLHGGGYSCGGAGGGVPQSIPIAGMGKIKVITIDYRTSPDYKFPAATEDVVAVYKELLKRYEPSHIGICGSSTGSTLAAGSVAWLQKEKLPRPGGIVLIGQGAEKDDVVDGDAWYMAPASMGLTVPASGQTFETAYAEPYLSGVDRTDPMVWPANAPEVLAQFPPTLLISGTRDLGLSEVLHTHALLVKANVEAELHVWDGMWHGFMNEADLPESIEAYGAVVKFFEKHLGAR